jgi:hypothetical protein
MALVKLFGFLLILVIEICILLLQPSSSQIREIIMNPQNYKNLNSQIWSLPATLNTCSSSLATFALWYTVRTTQQSIEHGASYNQTTRTP